MNLLESKTYREVILINIAPTLTAMLKTQMPNGSTGKVIQEVTPQH